MKKLFASLLLAGIALPGLAQETTPAMLAAAEKEGKVVWYSSVDVKVGEAVAKAFRGQYPKIEIEVERAGSERVFQRVNQEMQSGIKNADVVNSSDASHFLFWKQQGKLAKHTPPDAQKFPAQYRDPDGPEKTPTSARPPTSRRVRPLVRRPYCSMRRSASSASLDCCVELRSTRLQR